MTRLVSSDARVELRLDFRADVRLAVTRIRGFLAALFCGLFCPLGVGRRYVCSLSACVCGCHRRVEDLQQNETKKRKNVELPILKEFEGIIMKCKDSQGNGSPQIIEHGPGYPQFLFFVGTVSGQRENEELFVD